MQAEKSVSSAIGVFGYKLNILDLYLEIKLTEQRAWCNSPWMLKKWFCLMSEFRKHAATLNNPLLTRC